MTEKPTYEELEQRIKELEKEAILRKRAENKLQESKIFLENISDIAYAADNQGNVTWVNAAIEQAAGLPPEKIIGKPFLPLFIEPDQASLIDVYQRTLQGESLENTLTFKSGVTCHFTSLPKRNRRGDIIGTFGVARDISERMQAEESLLLSNQRWNEAQAVAKIGNWEFDVARNRIWGSPEAVRIYGIPQDKKTNQDQILPLDEVEDCIPERERVHQALVDLITEGKPYELEFEVIRQDTGVSQIIYSKANVSKNPDGTPLKVTGTIQDITDRKQAEIEKEKLENQLRQAQKMEAVGRLAGGVAHDFNNMLGVILGHADMLLEQIDTDQPFHADLEEIRNAGMRSADLTRQLLAFARKQTVAPKVIDLNKTVTGMTRMLKRLIGENIELAWVPDDKLWPVKIDPGQIDPGQIDQILANLCVNARGAIVDVGKVTIETGNTAFDNTYCETHAGFRPGEYVLLAVSDNGCGMNPETLDNVFEPFFTTKESGKGTGLGLATVYGAVKQNQGFINIYSEPGQGTTFKIYLPRHLAKAAETEERKPQAAARGRETILLVEDEPAILHVTTMMLEREGYRVVTAGTPGEAIELAHEHLSACGDAQAGAGEIHLLMTDVVMPEMNGRDLARNILSHYPNLKRLFMSGYTANVIAHHGVLDEGVNFIQKTFSREQLGDKVREALDKDKL